MSSTNNSSSSVKNGIIPSPPKVKKGVKLPPLSMPPPPPYSRLLSCPAYNEEDNLATAASTTPGTPGPGSKTFDWSGFVAAAAAAERPVAAPGNSPPPPGRPEAFNNVDGVIGGVGEVAACEEKKSTADVDKIADALADIEQVTTTTTSASDQSEDVDDDDVNKYNSYTPTAPPASPGGEDASSPAAGDSNVG